MSTINTKVLRSLTGDTSLLVPAAAIIQRLKQAVENEDLDVIIDLREANKGRVGK